MEDVLSRILARKAERLAARKRAVPLEEIERRAGNLPPPRLDLLAALQSPAPQGLHVIAEVKKASPSRGVIRADFDAPAIAAAYARGGASALSVLTEEDFFQGSDEFLRTISATVALPVLRKDFLTEAYQVFETKLLGAAAYLLIVACLSDAELRELIDVGRALRLTPLVEVHDAAETARAVAAGAPLLGINNRDLRTFRTDLDTTARLRKLIPPEIPVVSESGIFTRADVLRLREEGAQAVLVGESLMRAPDLEAKLRELLGS